jgi:DNA-binding response OmpR family regulator
MANGHFGVTTADGRRPHVAIVCGNVAGTTIALVLCEQFGCAPYAAQTGEAALALLRREAIDLVILDLTLPDMDGVAAAQLIRALGERGAMPIVALSEKSGGPSVERSRAAGFAGTVVKPYSPRELHAAIETALGRERAAAVASPAPLAG